MNQSPIFTSDHHGFYLKGAPFYPLIQETSTPLMEWSNTVVIPVAATSSDDLNFSEQKKVAEKAVKAGKYLFWDIDLGLCYAEWDKEMDSCFHLFSLAIEEFSRQLWPSFQDKTFGVALYRGPFPLNQEDPLFSAKMFAEDLHRLLCFLPDAALPFALIDVEQIGSMSKSCQLLSKARFEYLNLAIKGSKTPFCGLCWEEGHYGQGWIGRAAEKKPSPEAIPPKVGVYLPEDEKIAPHVLNALDNLFEDLQKQKMPFRIVSEDKLTELWDGLDTLIIPPHTLSVQGKRKLLGFAAAGGNAIYAPSGQKLGV